MCGDENHARAPGRSKEQSQQAGRQSGRHAAQLKPAETLSCLGPARPQRRQDSWTRRARIEEAYLLQLCCALVSRYEVTFPCSKFGRRHFREISTAIYIRTDKVRNHTLSPPLLSFRLQQQSLNVNHVRRDVVRLIGILIKILLAEAIAEPAKFVIIDICVIEVFKAGSLECLNAMERRAWVCS